MTALLVVTLVSLVLAIVMSVVAWRVARDERERADARVAALASDIQDAVAASGGRRSEPMLRAVRPAPDASADLFASSSSTASSRSVIVVGIGLFVFATLAALAVVLTSGARGSVAAPAAVNRANPQNPKNPQNPEPATRNPLPLDLVALGHERDGDRLIVRGVVRNPSAAAAGPLTAVVFAFDRDGGFVTSGRAAIDTPVIGPNNDSTFTVALTHAERVMRYRVSFRTDAAVVPHVDRRHD
jgi:hypothetical protein